MKVLILNSGLGSRMGVLTSEHPKCMTELSSTQTILSRQLRQIADAGIEEVVITTGYYDGVLVQYCNNLEHPLHLTFVKNPIYDQTNYIYSIYCARKYLDDDIILMHGDLVFENEVFEKVVASENSCMTVSSTLSLPEKDFKAQIRDGMVMKVGVDIFDRAMEAQALYKLKGTLSPIRFNRALRELDVQDDVLRTNYCDMGDRVLAVVTKERKNAETVIFNNLQGREPEEINTMLRRSAAAAILLRQRTMPAL